MCSSDLHEEAVGSCVEDYKVWTSQYGWISLEAVWLEDAHGTSAQSFEAGWNVLSLLSIITLCLSESTQYALYTVEA